MPCNKDYHQCNQNLPLVGARVSINVTLGKQEACQRLRKQLGRDEILPIADFYVHAGGEQLNKCTGMELKKSEIGTKNFIEN